MEIDKSSATVNLIFIPEFYLNEEDVILFAGTQEILMQFSYILEKCSYSVVDDFSWQKSYRPWKNTKVKLVLSEVEKGMRFNQLDEKPSFTWTVSKERLKEFIKLIREVANSQGPSHHYLDCDNLDEVTVVVSKDEYDATFFEKMEEA